MNYIPYDVTQKVMTIRSRTEYATSPEEAEEHASQHEDPDDWVVSDVHIEVIEVEEGIEHGCTE